MKKLVIFIIFTVVTLFSAISYSAEIKLTDDNSQAQFKDVLDPKFTMYIELKDGIVVAQLFPKVAPLHVQRIRTLIADGFYDNVKFHRVISGFMAQTGDPTGTGRGGSKLGKLYAEFNKEHHTRGTLSMARGSDVNSANSQFFIVTGDFFPELDNQYTIFGRVIEGMEYIDKIKVGDTSKNGMVTNPDIMIKVVTGDMLNNKSLETIKKEIKIINNLQNEKLKSDTNYKKRSILGILLQTKDIDINQTSDVSETTNDSNNKNMTNINPNNTDVDKTNSNVNNTNNNNDKSSINSSSQPSDSNIQKNIDNKNVNTVSTPINVNNNVNNVDKNGSNNSSDQQSSAANIGSINGADSKNSNSTTINQTNINSNNVPANNNTNNKNLEDVNFGNDNQIPTPYEGDINN